MERVDIDLPLWPRQRECLDSPANDQLFGGASEGGKSYLARVGIIRAGLECEGLQMKLIRKKYDDILSNHLDGDRGFRRLLAPLTARGVVEITQQRIRFPKDNVCVFVHCQDERQFDSAQGNESQVVVVDEAPQIKERLIRAFRGWCRITPEHRAKQPKFWQQKLPWFYQSGNPTGESVGYYRKYYVKARAIGEIADVDGFRRQFIKSLAQDNLSVDLAAHSARLSAIGDSALAKALDEGDWDAVMGEFFPEWDERRHVIGIDFTPPSHWFRYRTFDWGVAEPAYCAYWAVSDGEPFKDSQGRERWFPRGAIILYDEWFIADPIETHKGLRMRNEDMARGILDRSDVSSRDVITLTDSKPFQDTGGDGPASAFARVGCPLTMADTSRIAGWSQMRGRLIGQEFQEFGGKKLPMLYVMSRCRFARDYVPVLPRHPSEHKKEDAAEHGESTHVCDAIRYACMAHNNAVIRGLVMPMEVRIERAIRDAARKPTINSIRRASGHAGLH